ncbi:hypothetical protein EXN66_Car008512 [Channa argus]|uniref:Uncharacterized protein n=1 Tax=Channa argus TaxID=215402 RepID=A0A6G1PS65_CHAAH|nr:hypothetical protein EXN66_Car008512 [Channa argus]
MCVCIHTFFPFYPDVLLDLVGLYQWVVPASAPAVEVEQVEQHCRKSQIGSCCRQTGGSHHRRAESKLTIYINQDVFIIISHVISI